MTQHKTPLFLKSITILLTVSGTDWPIILMIERDINSLEDIIPSIGPAMRKALVELEREK